MGIRGLSGAGEGFLRNLAEDSSGNTLAIAAASILPMMALIGGGVDISRSYMAKTQLQSACDAGVLAGRRAMSKTGEYGDDEKAKADAMFNFNFDPDQISATGVSYETADNEDGQVVGTATATVPTLIMKVFNQNEISLEVACMAELQIGNADVMFVLDTTGSMAGSKIVGLREAVKDFHMTINQAVNDNRTRIRYGFVPYSMTVNVKGLLDSGALSSDYLADTTHYQSRLAVFNTAVYDGEIEDLGTVEQTYGNAISKNNCELYGRNDYPDSGDNPVQSGTKPNPVTTTEYDFVSWKKTGTSGSGWNRVDIGTCVRNRWQTRTTYEVKYKFNTWRYTEVPLSTQAAKQFQAVEVATNAAGTMSNALVSKSGAYDPILLARMARPNSPNNVVAENIPTTNYSWNGCIEERDTVTETDFDPLPDDAFDLDFDLEPYNNATRWKPRWENVEFTRSNYNSEDSTSTSREHVSAPCPHEMMLLRTVELSDDNTNIPGWLNTYLNNLVAVGNTYHDIGMIWGGRLTSPTGLFEENVNLDADKISVSKHIIFMTDGIMEPTASGYSAYGIENLDSRIAPRYNAGSITSRHNARFSAMCEAIKAQGTTIWVVAFGTSMTTQLQNCATGGRAYYSSNTETLRSTFKFIAAQVADLRLGA